MNEPAACAAIESAARDSYGRLIAYLAARTGDISGAEDALSDAFLEALRRWPVDGLPQKTEAWLLHVARNRQIDAARRAQVRQGSTSKLELAAEAAAVDAKDADDFPDERLKLLFVCAHPAIDAAARTPLMLQTVLGLDAARIASAFLISPSSMSQRLVRAKNKIRDAGIPFRVPGRAEFSERTSFVMDAIYSAYTAGWEVVDDGSSTLHGLAGEAIALGRTLVQLMPEEPEALGLLALMLHCEARREARHGRDGDFVPLDRQDTSLWSRPLMEEAEKCLRAASEFARPGRYQLEAAIQSIHANRINSGSIDWPHILLLYEGLAKLSPGIGAQIGRAVAQAESGNPAVGLATLNALPNDRILSYQPYWAVRGHLLAMLSRSQEARESFTRAASLTEDPAMRRHLVSRSVTGT